MNSEHRDSTTLTSIDPDRLETATGGSRHHMRRMMRAMERELAWEYGFAPYPYPYRMYPWRPYY